MTDCRVERPIVLSAALLLLVSFAATAHGPASVPKTTEPRLIEFPDTAEYRTLVVDLHTHSVFSDGHVWPRIRVEEALRDGLDALAVTEHLEYQPHLEDIPHPDRNRSYEETVAAVPEDAELIIIAGSEITRRAPIGHMNAVFIADANQLFEAPAAAAPFEARAYYLAAGEWPAQNAVDRANEQGAFVFWNHSWSDFSDGRPVINDFHRGNAASGKLHGIEIANGRTYSPESFQIALDHDLALIGVSDVHNLIDWDYEPHLGGHRPVNLVFAAEKSSAAIREALFARRTVVWFKNLLIGRSAELLPLLRASLVAESEGYGRDSEILEVTFTNRSDARFELRNLTGYSLVWQAETFAVAPHAEETVRFRVGERRDTVLLELEVRNALTAPGEHPVLRLELPAE